MPGQFEKMQGVWLLWPRNPNTWREDAKPARAAFANFIKLISKETSLKACMITGHGMRLRLARR
jgi:agmatine deiminase